MAEGLARAFLGKGTSVQSAGSHPTQVNPLAIQVMAEIGIDISSQRSKSVDEIDPDSFDFVITLCAEEVCPSSFENKKKLHWGLSDPAVVQGTPELKLKAFRLVRDQIRKKLEDLKP